ncbi:MAG: P-type conjugative transfer protein TrbL, partial [Sphingomicrobium sp.]
GAGAAIGTTAAAVGTLAVGGGLAAGGARAIGGAGLGAVRAGTSMGAAASTAYKLGQETSGSSSVGAGLSGLASAGGGTIKDRMANAGGLAAAAERGQREALFAGSSRSAVDASADYGGSSGAPDWARRLRAEQSARHHRQSAVQAIREGDGSGAAANPDIKEREE